VTSPSFPRRGTARRARSAAARVAVRTALALSLSSAPTLSSPKPPDHPRWAVLVASDNRSWYIDEPICNSQEYFSFSGAPQRFDYDHELSQKTPSEIKDKVYSQPLGGAPGYPVRQINHVINGNELTIKMILIQRKPNEFCEIYHQQLSPDMVSAEPAYLVQVGPETILASTDPWTGNSGQRQDVYWTFDKDGPLWLDVDSKVEEALKEFRPKEFIIMGGGGFDIRTLTYGMPLWKPSDPHCCPTGGSIEIKFALKDHQLVVVSQSYKEN
jgi:hypothetical protein